MTTLANKEPKVNKAAKEAKSKKSYTLEEFMALPVTDTHYELWEGKLIEMAPAREDHSRIGTRLITILGYFAMIQNDLGDVYGADSQFDILGNALSPDVAFVAKGRLLASQRGMTVIPLVPDIAVEVKSLGDTFPEVRKKVKKYQQAGVSLVWVIVPQEQTVQIYHPQADKPLILGVEAELDGEDVLNGFKLKISRLFEHS
jgi:Uma2 family endonuclease